MRIFVQYPLTVSEGVPIWNAPSLPLRAASKFGLYRWEVTAGGLRSGYSARELQSFCSNLFFNPSFHVKLKARQALRDVDEGRKSLCRKFADCSRCFSINGVCCWVNNEGF